MSVECTNPNLKTAQMAQLEQPAPKLELDLYIPQTQQSKIKNSFVIRRQKGINGELLKKKVGCSSSRLLMYFFFIQTPKLVQETGERLRGEERVEDARRIRDIKKSLQSPTQLQSREAALALFEKPEQQQKQQTMLVLAICMGDTYIFL